MVGSPITFGGVVVGLWHMWERKTSAKVLDEDDGQNNGITQDNEPRARTESSENYVATSSTIFYGLQTGFRRYFL